MTGAYLGLNLLHDTSAALVVDGELVAAAEQERFSGDRHTTAFPAEAIAYCLEHAGIRPRDVRETAVAFDYDLFEMDADPLTRRLFTSGGEPAENGQLLPTANLLTWRESNERLARHGLPNIRYLRHHLTHAACGYYLSDFDEANVLVLDGRGERESTTLWHAAGARIEHLDSYDVADSLGHVYSYVTGLCGLYSSFGNEGKTMGLAGYGTGKLNFDNVVTFDSRRYHVHWDELRAYDRYQVPLGKADASSAELAFAVQRRLEQAVEFLAARVESMTGCGSLVLAGGVALNCNANARLLGLPHVERLFVPPAANDAGTAAGAAFLRWVDFSGRRPKAPPSATYLGPDLRCEDIDSAVAASGLDKVAKVTDPAGVAAAALSAGLVVGWAQGRAEHGPRALGNRSILADPRDPRMPARLNDRVKFREPWRPFAPSVLSEHSADWFAPPTEAPYMLLALTVRPQKKDLIPAVTHVDGTSRIQTVRSEDNPAYYRLIRRFYEITGIPMVLNTSLNIRGEPMALTATDALRCFLRSGLDVLVLGNVVAWKDDVDLQGVRTAGQASA